MYITVHFLYMFRNARVTCLVTWKVDFQNPRKIQFLFYFVWGAVKVLHVGLRFRNTQQHAHDSATEYDMNGTFIANG